MTFNNKLYQIIDIYYRLFSTIVVVIIIVVNFFANDATTSNNNTAASANKANKYYGYCWWVFFSSFFFLFTGAAATHKSSLWRARRTSTILSLGCRPALSAGEFSSTALMYWPGRARSLCRLKPYPPDPRWITQSRGLSSGHTSWRRTGDKGNSQSGALIGAARRAKTEAPPEIPPP